MYDVRGIQMNLSALVDGEMKVLQHDEYLNREKDESINKVNQILPRSLQSLQTAAKIETEKSALTDRMRRSGNCKRIDLCTLVK